jgi:hypothetical protein
MRQAEPTHLLPRSAVILDVADFHG